MARRSARNARDGRPSWQMPDTWSMEAARIRQDPAAKERAKRFLWQLDVGPKRERQPYVYAILDAARDKRIYPVLRRLARTEQILGLYQGRTARELAAVAPYLVSLGTTDRVFDWLWDEGWGESWGIFLWSLVSPETLRAHFRRLTMVQSEADGRLLFRFYDPRVLRAFLPTCDAAQLRELFGPVQRFMAEQAAGTAVVSFRAVEQGGGGQPTGVAAAMRNDVRSTILSSPGQKGMLRLVEDTCQLDGADAGRQ